MSFPEGFTEQLERQAFSSPQTSAQIREIAPGARCGEFLRRRLPENHGVPNKPSPIFGHFVVGLTPSSAPPWPGLPRAPHPTKRT